MLRNLRLTIFTLFLLAGCATPSTPSSDAGTLGVPATATQLAGPQSPTGEVATPVAPASTFPPAPVASATPRGVQVTTSSTATLSTTPNARPVTTVTVPAATSATAAPSGRVTTAPAALPTPQMPVSQDRPKARYAVKEEQTVGPYVIRIWRDETDSLGFESIATISTADQPQVQIANASAIGLLTGKDLAGTGHPDAVIETYTGGAHCCFGTQVFELGPKLVNILDKPTSNCAGNFADLNGDGSYEFVTCDDSFAYTYCAFAGLPAVKVVFQYKPGSGYRPASPKFVPSYEQDIAEHEKIAVGGTPGSLGEEDGTNKCSVLPLVLDYLYTGRATEAWKALDQYYKGNDSEKFKQEINDTTAKSPYYISP